MVQFEMRSAKVIGISHRQSFTNCQDASRVMRSGRWIVGVVCDGMGSGEHSEVGALLSSHFITYRMLDLLTLYDSDERYEHLNMRDLGNMMWSDYSSFIHMITSSFYNKLTHVIIDRMDGGIWQSEKHFADTYLMSTVLILVVDTLTEVATIFSFGDGYDIVDDVVTPVDTYASVNLEYGWGGEGVLYPALTLRVFDMIKRQSPAVRQRLLRGFDMKVVGNQWNKIAITSDGFRFIEDNYIDWLWHGDAPAEFDENDVLTNALQLELEWGARQMKLKNYDDLSIVTVEKIETASENDNEE